MEQFVFTFLIHSAVIGANFEQDNTSDGDERPDHHSQRYPEKSLHVSPLSVPKPRRRWSLNREAATNRRLAR